MELQDIAQKIMDEIMELRERVTRNESSIISLIQQQTAIDNLVQSVQELALSIKEITIQNQSLDKRLGCIEDEKKSKNMYIWTLLIGGTMGTAITIIVGFIVKGVLGI